MADSEVEDSVTKAIEACNTAQAMIDINAEHLDGLRTQCATSAELTQHEIRTLEVSFLADLSCFVYLDTREIKLCAIVNTPC